MINEFPDITEIEAKHGFSIEALEQLEYIITYLNECASPELLKEIKISEDGFEQLVNYTTELRVFDGVNYAEWQSKNCHTIVLFATHSIYN